MTYLDKFSHGGVKNCLCHLIKFGHSILGINGDSPVKKLCYSSDSDHFQAVKISLQRCFFQIKSCTHVHTVVNACQSEYPCTAPILRMYKETVKLLIMGHSTWV